MTKEIQHHYYGIVFTGPNLADNRRPVTKKHQGKNSLGFVCFNLRLFFSSFERKKIDDIKETIT